jgi:hypothetical protein
VVAGPHSRAAGRLTAECESHYKSMTAIDGVARRRDLS